MDADVHTEAKRPDIPQWMTFLTHLSPSPLEPKGSDGRKTDPSILG